MADQSSRTPQPTRLYRKTYLQMLHNAIGSELFRNFYVVEPDGTEIDAMADGSDSCAFFVSSILTLFRMVDGIHGTIVATTNDLQSSGWQVSTDTAMRPGDVLVWEAQVFDGSPQEHIGFYLGSGRAVSTSWTEKKVIEHDATFGGHRSILQVFHYSDWA